MWKEQKFKKKVEWQVTSNDCWEVTSHSTVRGYPVMRDNWECRLNYMSRIFYKECFGEIPEGIIVRHKCDNPLCINPEHLELGTHQDNTNDKISRGRLKYGNCYGEDCNFSKLTKEQVLEIRKRHIKGARSGKNCTSSLAKEFNTSTTNIKDIVNKKIWTHI